MIRILRFLLLPCLIIFLGGFASPQKSWKELILGTWVEHIDESDSVSSTEEKTFYSDGTASGWFEIWELSAAGEKILVKNVKFWDRWKIEDGYMVCYAIRTDPKGEFSPKEEIRDRIIGITKTTFKYMAADGGICESTKKQ